MDSTCGAEFKANVERKENVEEESDTTYVGDGDAGGGLAAADAPEPGLVLDDAVGDAHLPAEGREEHHQLEGDGLVPAGLSTTLRSSPFKFASGVKVSSSDSVEEVTVYIMKSENTK